MIELIDVSKQYLSGEQAFIALHNINLKIDKNDYLAITGPSGSGKSSLMNVLGCLDTASSGQLMFEQQDVAHFDEAQLALMRNQTIGFIFQSFHLLPRISVLENVALPLIYQFQTKKQRIERAMAQLEKVGLIDKAMNLPSQLSGGQRQRVAIARALVTEPQVLLGDEPTGNLDSKTTTEIMALFDCLHQQGHIIILVTHENDIAQHCLRRVELVDGQIVEDCRQPRKDYA